jgi:hypothetical protein
MIYYNRADVKKYHRMISAPGIYGWNVEPDNIKSNDNNQHSTNNNTTGPNITTPMVEDNLFQIKLNFVNIGEIYKYKYN